MPPLKAAPGIGFTAEALPRPSWAPPDRAELVFQGCSSISAANPGSKVVKTAQKPWSDSTYAWQG